jgi:predicted metal-binding membrane protein
MGAHGIAALAVMWSVMMAAMMLPSAAPMVLAYAKATRSTALILIFLLGYVAIWSAYGLAAAGVQIALTHGDVLSADTALDSAKLKGVLLFAAGAYQWTSAKQFCLQRCRSPLSFILIHWREGLAGAFVMGVRHGGYCVGCCWALMLLLFAGGAMNPWLIVTLAALVLAEKVLAKGVALARVCGILLLATGAALVVLG